MAQKTISIVIPVYNEERTLATLHAKLVAVCNGLSYACEFIFVDDGSRDQSAQVVRKLAEQESSIRLISLSRNFGKEAATSAGIAYARGDAVVIIDADMQHPPELIPALVLEWEAGAEVVIGVRRPRRGERMLRRAGSRLFTRLMNSLSDARAPYGATDFRLIDRAVADAFLVLPERQRLTRALIDWLGFRRAFVQFDAAERGGGSAGYGYRKLAATAINALVAHSRIPLYISGALGLIIVFLAGALGFFVLIEQVVLGDPLGIEVSGSAMLAILILFLNGVLLLFLGLISVYVAAIQREVAGRPLYVVRGDRSVEHEHGA